MKINQERQPNRVDSFWYDGVIASEGNCILIASGDIRVIFPDGQDLNDSHAVCHAEMLEYTDADLAKLQFENNNWFEVISKQGEDILGDVVFTYDEAIELLHQYVKENIYP